MVTSSNFCSSSIGVKEFLHLPFLCTGTHQGNNQSKNTRKMLLHGLSPPQKAPSIISNLNTPSSWIRGLNEKTKPLPYTQKILCSWHPTKRPRLEKIRELIEASAYRIKKEKVVVHRNTAINLPRDNTPKFTRNF
jgi:hypothetical protein